jgi:hypothetical protein
MVVIRHTSNDRIVAMIEVLSAGNKSSRHAIRSFLDKAVSALDGGVHLLLVDVHPPGPRDPNGIHGAVLNENGTDDYALDSKRSLTVAAYTGGAEIGVSDEEAKKIKTVGDAIDLLASGILNA